MACSANLAGIKASCDSSMGGIKKVWMASVDDITPVLDASAETITGLTITVGDDHTKTVADVFKGYNFKKNTASMTSTLNVDVANGTNYVSTELALTFLRQDTDKRIEMAALAVADCYVIALDSNGKYWYLGYDEPVYATAGSANSGTAKSDGNNYQITLTDESNSFPYEITSSEIIDALKNIA